MGDQEERLKTILRELDLPLGQWVLAGSGIMVLHKIPREKPMGDVDIFVATRLWFELMNTGNWGVFTTEPDDRMRRCDPPYLYGDMHGLEVNIFHGWRRRGVGDIDVAHWIHNAEMVQGWPCVWIQMLLDWKRAVGRAKDVDDIQALERYLG